MALVLAITGTPISSLRIANPIDLTNKNVEASKDNDNRKNNNNNRFRNPPKPPVYYFFMREACMTIPSELPVTKDVIFTIFCSEKQLRKAGLTNENIKNVMLKMRGGVCTGVKTDKFQGQFCVSIFELEIIDNNPAKRKNPKVKLPTIDWKQESIEMPVEEITVPDNMRFTGKSIVRYEETKRYIKENGKLDKPVVITQQKAVYANFYRYLAARDLGFKTIPVIYYTGKIGIGRDYSYIEAINNESINKIETEGTEKPSE